MSEELFPCWRCGSPVKHIIHSAGRYNLNVWHCSEECGAFSVTKEDWQANARPAYELRQENARLRALVERGCNIDLADEKNSYIFAEDCRKELDRS